VKFSKSWRGFCSRNKYQKQQGKNPKTKEETRGACTTEGLPFIRGSPAEKKKEKDGAE